MHQTVCTSLVLYSSFHSTIYDPKYSVTRLLYERAAMQHSQGSSATFLPLFNLSALGTFVRNRESMAIHCDDIHTALFDATEGE